MKRLILALSAILLLCGAAASADGGAGISYANPDDVSIEDVFFSRFAEQIYNADSTIRARRVEADPKIDEARWDKNFSKLTLWGEGKQDALATYNAAVRLFLKTQSAKYADIAERALYNGVLAELDSSRRGSPKWREAAQAVMNAPATAYAAKGADLWVNLYFRNRSYIKSDSLDMLILQNTSAPWAGNVFISLKFNNPGGTRMRLHLRLPAWMRGEVTPTGEYSYAKAREFYQVLINGRLLTLRASADGYITIDRVWQSDDVVRLSMQAAVRRIRRADSPDGKFAIQEGPILYAYETRGEKKYFDPKAAYGNSYDNETLHTNCLVTKVYSSPNKAGESPWEANLLPYYVAFGRNLNKPEIWLDEVGE